MAVRTRKGRVSTATRASTPRRSFRRPSSSPPSPATRCSRTRPSSAPMPSPRIRHPPGRRAEAPRNLRNHARRKTVGWNANRLSLGKLSGRNAFRTKLSDSASPRQRGSAQCRVRPLQGTADKKREIFDEDLQALVSDEGYATDHERYIAGVIESVFGDRRGPARATGVHRWKARKSRPTRGFRPVDATFKALESVSTAAPTCCCIRSTTLPAAPTRRRGDRAAGAGRPRG